MIRENLDIIVDWLIIGIIIGWVILGVYHLCIPPSVIDFEDIRFLIKHICICLFCIVGVFCAIGIPN
ncbi:hypothetical protein MTLP_04400 [Candidatus Methanoliparum sp. LAM-1]|nr:hypothetical protein MTLP_04400 [Candidatus Methanoliparum sp. LAM-1]